MYASNFEVLVTLVYSSGPLFLGKLNYELKIFPLYCHKVTSILTTWLYKFYEAKIL